MESSYNDAAAGVSMFAEAPSSNRRRNTALAVSFVVHVVVIYFLVRPPKPIYVTPNSVAFGHGGTTTELVYFSQQGSAAPSESSAEAEPRRIALPTRVRDPRHTDPRHTDPRHTHPKPVAPSNTQVASAQPVRAGTPYGSFAQGLDSGHDVRPALPLIYPNPDILPWQVPSGVQGNVIVEVTIDAQGNVTEAKVLQGLGHGIEEKVVAALRNWRFRPAMMDGRAIPSQQDVYFHFPS